MPGMSTSRQAAPAAETPEQRLKQMKTDVLALVDRMGEGELNRILRDPVNLQYQRDIETEAAETAENKASKKQRPQHSEEK